MNSEQAPGFPISLISQSLELSCMHRCSLTRIKQRMSRKRASITVAPTGYLTAEMDCELHDGLVRMDRKSEKLQEAIKAPSWPRIFHAQHILTYSEKLQETTKSPSWSRIFQAQHIVAHITLGKAEHHFHITPRADTLEQQPST